MPTQTQRIADELANARFLPDDTFQRKPPDTSPARPPSSGPCVSCRWHALRVGESRLFGLLRAAPSHWCRKFVDQISGQALECSEVRGYGGKCGHEGRGFEFRGGTDRRAVGGANG